MQIKKSCGCVYVLGPDITPEGAVVYIVFGNESNKAFEELNDAISFAATEAKTRAKAEAQNRGAKGEIILTHSVKQHSAEAQNSIIELGATVTAHAVGSIGY